MRNRPFPLVLAAVLALGVTGAAIAQGTPPPDQAQDQQGRQGRGPMRMDPDRQLEHMTKELGLTADQQTQIKPLLVDRQQKMQALFQNQSLAQEDRRTQMHTISEGTNNSIKALLNDDQKQKFAAIQDRPRRGRGGPGGPPAGGAPQPQL